MPSLGFWKPQSVPQLKYWSQKLKGQEQDCSCATGIHSAKLWFQSGYHHAKAFWMDNSTNETWFIQKLSHRRTTHKFGKRKNITVKNRLIMHAGKHLKMRMPQMTLCRHVAGFPSTIMYAVAEVPSNLLQILMLDQHAQLPGPWRNATVEEKRVQARVQASVMRSW